MALNVLLSRDGVSRFSMRVGHRISFHDIFSVYIRIEPEQRTRNEILRIIRQRLYNDGAESYIFGDADPVIEFPTVDAVFIGIDACSNLFPEFTVSDEDRDAESKEYLSAIKGFESTSNVHWRPVID